jgi:hypothetical protein
MKQSEIPFHCYLVLSMLLVSRSDPSCKVPYKVVFYRIRRGIS